tara:strand:+ start:4580 stop:4741 length:162 start_codon:yes stop_codon:yes gene_type:complete
MKPKPKVKEKDDIFIGRCLGDSFMIENYKNKTQRKAECCSQLKKRPKKRNVRT